MNCYCHQRERPIPLTVKEAFSDLWKKGNGIFTLLIPDFDFLTGKGNLLDLQYYVNHSGEKIISPLVEEYLVDGLVPENQASLFSNVVKALFLDNWKKTYEVLIASYNPLNNYDMTESEHGTDTNSGSNTYDRTETPRVTITRKSTGEASQNDGIYGFDSAESAVNSTAQSGKNTVEASETPTGENTEHSTETLGTSKAYDRRLTRSGNIGVTTSQQMAESEIKLREWQLYNRMFDDVDRVLTCPIYYNRRYMK